MTHWHPLVASALKPGQTIDDLTQSEVDRLFREIAKDERPVKSAAEGCSDKSL